MTTQTQTQSQTPSTPSIDATLAALIQQLQRLQDENTKLKTAQAAKVKKEDSLPQMPNYDTKLFVSIDDIFVMLKDDGVLDGDDNVVDARYFVKLFGLKGQAQVKETLGRGRGKVLYFRSEAQHGITKLLELRR